MSITDKEVFKDYYNDTLGELIEYDKNNDSNILEVLKYYLENNGSVQKTAEHFYVHRNSINYRLNKDRIYSTWIYLTSTTAYNCGLLLW